MNKGNNNITNQQETKSEDLLNRFADTKVDNTENNKNKFVYFENEYNVWKEKYYSLLDESTDFYNNKCCPKCGIIIEKELKKSIECDGCKSILLVKKHPELKNNILIQMKDDSYLEKCVNEFKFLKFAEESIKSLEIWSSENYISEFLKFKNEIPNGYTVFDIVYRFSSSMYEDKCSELDDKMYVAITNNNVSDMRKVYFQYSRVEVFLQMTINSLFEAKSYHVLLTYLPIFFYRKISQTIFFENLEDGYFDNIKINDFLNNKNIDKDRIINLGLNYNDILRLLKEYKISIEDFKSSFYDSVKESTSPFKVDKNIVWKIMEINILFYEKYNKKIKEARKEARKKKSN